MHRTGFYRGYMHRSSMLNKEAAVYQDGRTLTTLGQNPSLDHLQEIISTLPAYFKEKYDEIQEKYKRERAEEGQ